MTERHYSADIVIRRGLVILKACLLFLPVMMIISGLALFFYQTNVHTAEELLREQEQVVVDLQRNVLGEEIEGIVSDILFLKQTLLQAGTVWEEDAPAIKNRQHLEALMLNFAQTKGLYDQVRFIDKGGRERIRINYNNGHPKIVTSDNLQDKGQRYYFKDTFSLEPDSIFVSPLDLNIERGEIEQPLKPMLRVGTPVIDDAGQKRGIVLVNYFASILLNRFERLGRTSPGVSLLVNDNGYFLLGISPGDAWGFMYPDRVNATMAIDFPEVWSRIQGSQHGQFKTSKGLFTFTTVNPIPGNYHSSTGASDATGKSLQVFDGDKVHWKIVSWLPSSSYHAEASEMRRILLPGLLLSGLLLAFGAYRQAYSWAFRQASSRRNETLVRELRQALDEVKIIQGIIPICLHCKKIRNDEEAWDRLENYFMQRADVQFSHGVCPDCLDEYYGK